ncbi:MAG: hypothetical protein A2Y71_07485 [Bacteroidetes bacterium RBG_13_42_15]|nr:MAG: hypothetical protein A2Y71_07485 [Bacteroidetes bacterium RBG_13_42_15]
MKKQFVKYFIAAGLIVMFSGISNYVLSQNSGGAVKLEYNYPAGKEIRYLNSSTMTQTMDIQGQTMQSDVKSAFGCTVKSAGKQDNNLKLEIRIDTLGQTTNSPMGSSGGAMQGITGKTCNIVIAPDGKTVDLSEAGSLVYNVEGSGESNMTQSLSDFFQVLPAKPVKPGETWNITDSITVKSSAMTMNTIDTTLNKLEGFETVNGIECAKISTQHSGTMSMTVQNQGMDIYIKGPFKGTSECLFAVKEGYFIKLTSATKVNGKLEITSPEAMTFPIVIEMKGVNEVK